MHATIDAFQPKPFLDARNIGKLVLVIPNITAELMKRTLGFGVVIKALQKNKNSCGTNRHRRDLSPDLPGGSVGKQPPAYHSFPPRKLYEPRFSPSPSTCTEVCG